MQPEGEDVTDLLIEWGNGNESAFERLVPYVLSELRHLAAFYMRRERPGHILQTTALVNEAWLRLIDQTRGTWESRAHFFSAAARIMRQILVDYARNRESAKRGGDFQLVNLDNSPCVSEDHLEHYLILDEALQKLALAYPRKSRVVELRYFGGMNVEETAHVLGVSANTVIADWKFAKAWLRREIGPG